MPLVLMSMALVLTQPAVLPDAALSGFVFEAARQAPIAGVRVTLIPLDVRAGPTVPSVANQNLTALTDHDGRYEFNELEAGRYRMMFHKVGFAGVSAPDVAVTLKRGERRENLIVSMQKGAVITGRILDDTGEPLFDARVVAMRKPAAARDGAGSQDPSTPANDVPLRTGRPMAVTASQTNDLGEFRLINLPPGEYVVQAMSFDRAGASLRRGRTMLATYFPETTDLLAAQPIVVGVGETFDDVIIRLIGLPAFHISGVVLDEARRPVVNALVKLVADAPTEPSTGMASLPGQARAGPSGKFTIGNVTDGVYTLLVIAPVVLSTPADRSAAGGGDFTGFSGVVSGFIAPGIRTETSGGTTIQYRDDTATRVPIVLNSASISDLEVIWRLPAR